MKNVKRELRLYLFILFLNWCWDLLPKEGCDKIKVWMAQFPHEDLN